MKFAIVFLEIADIFHHVLFEILKDNKLTLSAIITYFTTLWQSFLIATVLRLQCFLQVYPWASLRLPITHFDHLTFSSFRLYIILCCLNILTFLELLHWYTRTRILSCYQFLISRRLELFRLWFYQLYRSIFIQTRRIESISNNMLYLILLCHELIRSYLSRCLVFYYFVLDICLDAFLF